MVNSTNRDEITVENRGWKSREHKFDGSNIIRVFIVSVTVDIGNIEFNQDYRVKCSLIKVRITMLLKIYRRYYLITVYRTLRHFYCIAHCV